MSEGEKKCSVSPQDFHPAHYYYCVCWKICGENSFVFRYVFLFARRVLLLHTSLLRLETTTPRFLDGASCEVTRIRGKYTTTVGTRYRSTAIALPETRGEAVATAHQRNVSTLSTSKLPKIQPVASTPHRSCNALSSYAVASRRHPCVRGLHR